MNRFVLAAVLVLAVSAHAKAPRLTLFITVDSFGSDLFQKNRSHFKFGLARMINEGAVVPTVRYEQAETVTAAGHTTLVTGANPARHGIVGNRILNRSNGRLEAIFADPGHPALDAPLGPDDVSPAALLAETLSDRLRASTQLKGKSLAISGKARGAIPMAGRLGDAWWFQEQLGRFITGTWYRKEAPTWVKTFNDRKPAEAYFAKKWELLAPAKDYLGDDDRPQESDWYGMTRVFPHPLNGGLPTAGPQSYSALASSPMFNELTVDFAKAGIEAEGLGKDDVPDLLSVSFSSVDRIFHLYGPNSWEMQDDLMRLDKSIGDLIAAAERAAGGRQNLVVVLSADHGGSNVPEQWASMGLEGARVYPITLKKLIDDELGAKLGLKNAVAVVDETDVYLDWKVIADKKLDLLVVRRAVAAILMRQPEVAISVAGDDLGGPDPLGLLKALQAGYHPDRSGDVLVVLKPFRVIEVEVGGTSHGSPYSYDAEVPMLLWGRGVKPVVHPGRVRSVDVAATAAALMELGNPASCEGSAVSEVLNLPK